MAFKFEKLMPKLRKEEKKESPAEEPKEKKPKEEPQGDEERSRKEYQEIKELKKKIDSLLEKPSEENIKEIEEMQEEAGKRIYQLREKFWPFENLPQKELKEQYENQKEILERVGILEKLSTGEIGIKGIDNKEYAFPEYQEIARRIRENKEILKPKTEQGFNQLLITPFGMKIDDLIKRYKQIILKHHREGKLLATKERPTDPDKPLELDENQPVWVWDKYNNADINGELVYFPKEFSKENHKGKTKQEIIKERGGFSVMFI
ncbi:hypothetical protein KJ636_04610, partial [Patescibacteria group bacterium]|nr:hypothetical protein [Patescibacteria group bacterium]